MAKLINCSRCGAMTEELTINKKTIKNCKKCRDAHNNKIKGNKNKNETTSNTTQEEYMEEENPEVKDDITEQQTENKSIKQLLQEIIDNIKRLTEINKLQHENTTEMLDGINNKLDNTINNINNTTYENNNNNLSEFIKSQQLQNTFIVNKLDNIINAII